MEVLVTEGEKIVIKEGAACSRTNHYDFISRKAFEAFERPLLRNARETAID